MHRILESFITLIIVVFNLSIAGFHAASSQDNPYASLAFASLHIILAIWMIFNHNRSQKAYFKHKAELDDFHKLIEENELWF